MFRPESDWLRQDLSTARDFRIEAAATMRDTHVDIRSFEWMEPTPGILSPAKHYLVYSLSNQQRRSKISFGRSIRRVTLGDILYLPPHREYIGEPGPDDRRVLCVALGEDFLHEVCENITPLDGFEPCLDMQNLAMRRLLQGLACELQTPGFASHAMIQATLMSLAVELFRHVGGSASDPGPARCGRQVRQITEFVLGNLSRPLSIVDIARDCNMSVRHVARVFKEGTGSSLGEFVARSRIAFAKELLRRDDAQIKEISWKCGFKSTSAFCAAFRSATGVTPKAYRSPSRQAPIAPARMSRSCQTVS